MATAPVKGVVRHVKPLLSVDKVEARKRVIQLYKAWYRQVPSIIFDFRLVIPISVARERLRQEFEKNKHVTDIRVIDMLVVKGQMEFKEITQGWKQKSHVMYYFKDTRNPQPTNFLANFLSGTD